MTNQIEYIETQPSMSANRITRDSNETHNLMESKVDSSTNKEKPWKRQQERERQAWRSLRRLWQRPNVRLKNSKHKF